MLERSVQTGAGRHVYGAVAAGWNLPDRHSRRGICGSDRFANIAVRVTETTRVIAKLIDAGRCNRRLKFRRKYRR